MDHIYLVDPQGNLMMRFPRDPTPQKVIRSAASAQVLAVRMKHSARGLLTLQ